MKLYVVMQKNRRTKAIRPVNVGPDLGDTEQFTDYMTGEFGHDFTFRSLPITIPDDAIEKLFEPSEVDGSVEG